MTAPLTGGTRRSSVIVAGALLAGVLSSPALGQDEVLVRATSATSATDPAPARTGTLFQLTPYTGYMIFGKFLDGPLGTSVSSAGGPLYGAQLGMKLAPGVSLVGNVAYSSGDLRVGIPFLGGISVGHSRALVSDAGLQLDLPSMRSSGIGLLPFVQAGVGAIRYDIDLGESILQTRATNLTGNVGVGADVPLGRSAALRFMAKDYIGKFDLKEATYLDVAGKTTHNWALSAGVRVSF